MIYLLFLGYLALTATIEGAAVMILFRRKEYVYYSFLCNLLTNPALNLLLLLSVKILGKAVYFPALFLAETTAVFVEAAVYKYLCRFSFLKSAALSVFLNALSLSAGIFIGRIISV